MSSSVYLSKSVIETLKCYGVSVLIASIILFVVPLFLNYFLLYYVGGVLFLASIFAPFISRWLPKEKITPDGKAVFISGCDRGFGYMLAQRLDDIGFHVFAGCLFPEGVGAKSLLKSGSKRLHVIGLDVTSDSSVQQAVAYVEENLGDNVLWAVVNNAGIVRYCELSWVSMESIIEVIDVNTFGVIRLTKAFLMMLKESQGRVVTIASIAGRCPIPNLVPYSVSKSAAIAFCDGLRLEMYRWNIRVITIEPAVYSTPIGNMEEIEKNSRLMWESSPKKVKDACGSDYTSFEAKLRNLYGYMKYFFREPSEVVSVIEEALTTLNPEYSYSPGSVILFFFCWLYNVLPKSVSDMLVYVGSDFKLK